ncbi:uncharacterized protein LOC117175535 [Belonocnema kinseyi]|uniref:uncharacterized protein LOC117175535 n=1 Tax=Belonocnema kinseyi TaxID=2817044 RepID=UPI00143D7617|nr:uncharacterized protein LOC117175535 [Belonocnema kinseyi]
MPLAQISFSKLGRCAKFCTTDNGRHEHSRFNNFEDKICKSNRPLHLLLSESQRILNSCANQQTEHVNSGPQDLLYANHVTHATAVSNGLPSEPSTLLSDGHSYTNLASNLAFLNATRGPTQPTIETTSASTSPSPALRICDSDSDSD